MIIYLTGAVIVAACVTLHDSRFLVGNDRRIVKTGGRVTDRIVFVIVAALWPVAAVIAVVTLIHTLVFNRSF